MVQREVVKSVYDDLKALYGELKANRENPHIIRVVQNLLRLTSLGEDEATETEEQAVKETSEAAPPATLSAEDCPHKVSDIYGRCMECGTCQHTQIRDGFCVTCGNEADKSTVEMASSYMLA